LPKPRKQRTSAPRVGLTDIDYGLAPFGKLEYGREFYGLLVYEKSDGCSPFRITTASSETEFPYAVLIKSGNCNINLKVSNAENAGAKLVIIESESQMSLDDFAANANDSLSMKINIPALTVSQSVGESLQKLMLKTGDVILKFTYPIPKSNTVEVNVALNLADDKFISFFKELDTYLEEFEDKITLRFELFREKAGDMEKAEIEAMLNCLNVSEATMALSEFRNACIAQKTVTFECFKKQLESLEKPRLQQLETCYQKEAPRMAEIESQMKILTPASRSFILLNRMIFRGTLKAQNVFEAICSAFVTSPDVCLYLDNKFTLNQDFRSIRDKSSQNKFWIIILNIVVLVVLLCVAALAMILIFGKIYQRILNENVSEMVRNSINNYSMSQERS